MIDLKVSDIKQFLYCPRNVYFTYVCPVDKKTTHKMNHGKEEHLELERLEKRRTFRRYRLENGERKFHPPRPATRFRTIARFGVQTAIQIEFVATVTTCATFRTQSM